MAGLGTHAETLQQLNAARQWLKFIITELDIDTDEAAVTVHVVSPSGEREAARVTLTESLSHIDACLEAHRHVDR